MSNRFCHHGPEWLIQTLHYKFVRNGQRKGDLAMVAWYPKNSPILNTGWHALFYRDPAGRPISKPSLIDEYLVGLNQSNDDDKTRKDEGIATFLSCESYREKQKKSLTRTFWRPRRPA